MLDLARLDPVFDAVFGATGARAEWFHTLLQLSLVANAVGDYADFAALGRRALRTLAELRGRTLAPADVDAVMRVVPTLAPHPDVIPALERLGAAGFRLATLTNSPPATVAAQMAAGGITDRFEALLSVDAVRRYKPAPEPYAYAAATLGVPIGELLLVAAHGWDVYGAMCAGARAAFVARPGQGLIADVPAPEIVESTLDGVAAALIARYR